VCDIKDTDDQFFDMNDVAKGGPLPASARRSSGARIAIVEALSGRGVRCGQLA